MRFALLGKHPDAVALALALAETGRHQIVAFTARLPDDVRQRWPGARLVRDLEEVLADPAVDAVLVAGHIADRPVQLRRALQAERHVFCVHPPDRALEIAYEAGMIRQDVRCVLLPILGEGLHPAVRRLAEFVERVPPGTEARGPIGAFRLVEVERAEPGEVLAEMDAAIGKPCFPGWDVLRRLGGEIAEVSAFAAAEEMVPGEPVLLAGRFERGGLFRSTLLPRQRADGRRLTVVGERGHAELLFPHGGDGPARLGWRDATGEWHEEYWDAWDARPALIEAFEARLKPSRGATASEAVSLLSSPPRAAGRTDLDWTDAIRALELDDAARRSVTRRRTSPLEYPDASEEVGFKGTMTLAGCAIFWVVLVLLIVSRWVPVVGWLIVPLLVIFLGLQFLRYAVPEKEEKPKQGPRG
jgi:predicted dehydrogenase